MKKKLLSILLVLTMVSALLMACSGGAAEEAEAPAEEATEEVAEEAEAPAEEAEEAAPAAEAPAYEFGVSDETADPDALVDPSLDYSVLKVGVLLTLTANDGGWCQAQAVGVEKARQDCGMSEDQIIIMENIEEESVTVQNVVEQLVDEGCNVIMGCSTGYAPILNDLTSQYPDVQFVQVGAPQPNLVSYQIRDYEGMFLLGYLCATMSPTDELGYSAGQSEASVRRGINAFALGAKYKNPNATVQVQWANSWYDPDAEAQCANSLISTGITYLGINASSPAIAQACEKAGAFCCGYHQDMHDYAPGAVLFSYVWNWGPIMENIWTTFVKLGCTPYVDYYFWGSKYGCPSISDFNDDLVPQEVQDEVLDIQKQIIAGDIQVYAGPLNDNEGNELVADGEVMDDTAISNQEFLVENVIGTWH